MVPALTESETHQIRIFLRKIHRTGLPSTTFCKNGPHCVYHRHQRCWFAHENDRDLRINDADNNSDTNLHETQINSSIKPAANYEDPTAFSTSINVCGQTEPCSTKPPRPQDRARETKTSAVQTISNAVQCSEFSASAVLNESQAATITANCEIPTALITPINAGVQTETCSLITTCTKGVPHFRATLIFQETQRIFASALCSYHRDILRPRPSSSDQAQQPVSAVKSIQTESPEFFETSSQTNPRVHHTRAVCHESQVFCTHLAPKHRKVRAFQFQLPVTSFRTRAVIFDTQVQQACLPYRRSTHNPYDPAPREKSDIRTRNFWSILRDENDEHVLELPIQDNEEDPNHQWTTTTQRRRKPQESHRDQSPSQLNYLCKCCRRPFQVSVSQAHWFLERSLNIPKRCEK